MGTVPEEGREKLGPGRPVEVTGRYTHMMPEDIMVWEAYIQGGARDLKEVWYDIHVGKAVELPPEMPAYMRAVANAVTRKRIDAVARVEGGFWIIEIKPYGNMHGLGQAIMYRELFRRYYDEPGLLEGVLLCGQVDVDVVEIAAQEGITIIALGGVLL